ncbi:hypothetical protein IFM89_008361 [Coptis chinensis]|uniref:Transposase Tnp1/En/Spm-like domain-containing protein n=1 Tax=Coptis chinensis TaxID=261450 RepID=A0A835IM06_9MAGN|nr:hypothetical protein IFM89_008361 [Coptis chinensis]
MDEAQTHSSSHSLSDSLGDDLGETHISGASTSSSKETRGPSISVSEELPEGYEKVIIKLNEWGQPDEPKEEVDHFLNKLGHIARRDIPIRYDSWKPVRSYESIIPKAIKTLGRMYVFENIDTIDTDWTISKFQKAWKEYKHELFKKYVKDQPPSFVREHPKQGIPLQDWQQFVDSSNSEKFNASILRNTENRKQQKNSSCLGRKSAAVAKVEMAKEKGVPVSSITRLDQYMHNHKRKNGEHQDQELVEKLNDYTALHPESRETSVNDALTKVLGPDSSGCFRGLGERVCKTSVKKMKVMAQQNLALKEMNTDLVKRVNVLQNTVLENSALLREFMSQGRMLMADVESPCSSHASPVVNEYIGKECDLRGGWPLKVVARSIVQDIDPNTEFGNRRLEEGNFKVHVNVFYDGGVVLRLPHDDWRSKLGEVAQGSVI